MSFRAARRFDPRAPLPGQGPADGRRRRRLAIAGAVALAFGILMLGATARAERWICPDCPEEIVERAPGSIFLACPKCKASYNSVELTPPLCYASVSTRDTELAWNLAPENCRIYKTDGLETLGDHGDTLWVPWILVDWFIPRMRLARLTDGREVRTDYAKDPHYCPEAPKFSYEVSDSISMPGRPASVFREQGQYSLAELFIVAFTPESRDSARVRFVAEVEAGKHRRLPRTEPRVSRLPEVVTPAALARPDLRAETVLEIRVHEKRGIIGAHVVQGSGSEELDRYALSLAPLCSLSPAGELGVPVPCWVRLRVKFEGAAGSVSIEPAPKGFWRR